MSWSEDKTGEITIGGWDAGIAPSPHKGNGMNGSAGVADLKGVNISSVSGEVSVAYNRVRVDQPAIVGATATTQNASANIGYTGTIAVGTWIQVSNVTGLSNITNTNYYQVVNVTGGTEFQISATFGGSVITPNSNGSFTFTTLTMGVPISYAIENSGGASSNSYRHYVLDNGGVIWVSGTASVPGSTPSPLSTTMTWSAITPHVATPGINSTDTTIQYGGSISIMYSTNSNNVVTGSYIILFTDSLVYYMKNNTGWPAITGTDLIAWSGVTLNYVDYPHRSYFGYDQTLYFTDGPSIGIIKEKPLQILTTTAPLSAGATSATLVNAWSESTTSYSVLFSDGDTKTVTFTGGSTAITWTGGLTAASSNVLTIAKQSFNPGVATTFDYINPNYLLPPEDAATFISSLPSSSGSVSIVVGGLLNNIYFFPTLAQQTQPGPTSVLWMPEANTQYLLQANNFVFIFCGNKGNIYLTNGSAVISVMTVPDYVAGSANFTQDPYFVWGGAMYLRGRLFFSIKDQNANHTGNCGGVWSFAPSFAAFFNQDVGIALRMEQASSLFSTWGFNGYAPIIFAGNSTSAQQANGPQYLACWSQGNNDGSGIINSIDFSGTQPLTDGSSIIETDAVPVGTFLNPRTLTQIEVPFAAPLVTGEYATINYRTSLENPFVSAGIPIVKTAPVGDGAPVSLLIEGLNFQKVQLIQLQVILKSTITNPSWCRMLPIKLR